MAVLPVLVLIALIAAVASALPPPPPVPGAPGTSSGTADAGDNVDGESTAPLAEQEPGASSVQRRTAAPSPAESPGVEQRLSSLEERMLAVEQRSGVPGVLVLMVIVNVLIAGYIIYLMMRRGGT